MPSASSVLALNDFITRTTTTATKIFDAVIREIIDGEEIEEQFFKEGRDITRYSSLDNSSYFFYIIRHSKNYKVSITCKYYKGDKTANFEIRASKLNGFKHFTECERKYLTSTGFDGGCLKILTYNLNNNLLSYITKQTNVIVV